MKPLQRSSILRPRRQPLAAALLVAVLPTPLWAGDWYVDDDGDCANGDGSSGNPFCAIQDAIDLARAGDTIHVQPGVYVEGLVIDRDLSVVGTLGREVTIVDGSGTYDPGITINAGVTAHLHGITMTRGRLGLGGGISNSGSLTLTGCLVAHNAGQLGGGLYNDGQATIVDCTFSSNTALWGGGLFNAGILDLRSCLIQENESEGGGGWPAIGAGIFCLAGDMTIVGTVVRGNSFTGSSANGSGLEVSGGTVTVQDSLIVDNRGFGIRLKSNLDARVDLIRSTVAGNHGGSWDWFGEGIHNDDGAISMEHSVAALVSGRSLTSHGHNLIREVRCPIEGDETGNLYDIDPLFADPDGPDDDPDTWRDNDRSLQSASPCVDAGNPALAPTGSDLNGNPRLLDGNLDRAMVLDMGAYEFNNVHLSVTGDATPGGTLTFETTGKEGLITLLFVGVASGEILLKPYGSLFLDVSQPYSFFPFAVIPDTRDVVVPPTLIGPLEVILQELAMGIRSRNGNFSNVVKLVIEAGGDR